MTTLLLRLAGPMQAWGAASRHARRETCSEPTKSGVLGLIAAAQGRRRSDPLEDLAGLRFGVRVDQPGRLRADFQTAIRWQDGTSMPLSYRYYLEDARFLAAVEGTRDLVETLADAIRRPVYPLFLGRRSCPTEGRIFLGLTEESLEEALRSTDWLAGTWHRRRVGRVVSLSVCTDTRPGQHPDESIQDVPVSFNPERRLHGWRDVSYWSVNVDNPLGRDEMDFMSLVGG